MRRSSERVTACGCARRRKTPAWSTGGTRRSVMTMRAKRPSRRKPTRQARHTARSTSAPMACRRTSGITTWTQFKSWATGIRCSSKPSQWRVGRRHRAWHHGGRSTAPTMHQLQRVYWNYNQQSSTTVSIFAPLIPATKRTWRRFRYWNLQLSRVNLFSVLCKEVADVMVLKLKLWLGKSMAMLIILNML